MTSRFKTERISGISGKYAVVDKKTGAQVVVLPCRESARDWSNRFNSTFRIGETEFYTLTGVYRI